MPHAKIKVYDPNIAGTDVELDAHLPQHVTMTGQEDHFELATHDAAMYVRGIRDYLRAKQDAIPIEEGKKRARHKIYVLSLIMD